jgi:very-short-patch-repair endonuclease
MYYRRYARLRNTVPELVSRAKTFRQNPTPAEAVLWQALRGRQVSGAKFRRQHSVGNFILDFWCPEHRLVIEVDGDSHDLPEIHEKDLERQCWMEAHQVRILRFRNEEVLFQIESVLLRINRALSPP